ncbi:ABC transporter permease [Staphylococcus sp. 17KM0847]|uniref:ABC transporter permease EcsB n=1 Tax=Staphylococcus sp. 17KM0847 TaxID=2583989 RepID=UPI0015DCC6A5|nr:ABC transporter permease [Staphylococcus sp. 17KM0847]QLK86334.1 ABC transporter permease [Staphylococcus sp. 17KM0847]
MMTAKQLFIQRHRTQIKEKQYYNKFIFNGHFIVFLTILIGAFILGYGQWLRNVPEDINYALLIAMTLSMSSIFPLKTLLEDADGLFLLPFERQMHNYIKQSIWVSYYSRLPLQVLLLVIAYPLWRAVHPNDIGVFVIASIMALLFPLLGLMLRWQWFLFGLENWSFHIVMFILSLSGYYVMLSAQSKASFGSIIALACLYALLKKMTAHQRFPWDFLIKQAHQHKVNYYKFVNMFTDVKGIQEGAVRRRYLDILLTTPRKFNAQKMYPYLFKRNFLRGKDAFHLTLRLIVIGILLMLWLNHPIISLLIGCLTIYITILQMSQFYTQESYGLWPQVWPVAESMVIEGYRQFLYTTVMIIATFLSVIYLFIAIHYGYLIVFFFIVGLLTIKHTIKKLKYRETLLRD